MAGALDPGALEPSPRRSLSPRRRGPEPEGRMMMPGWSRARTGIGRWSRAVRPSRRDIKADALAGLPGAISRVPDGMAASVLAGVNPVHGLYASIFGPVGGGLSSSTRRMVITTTGASALAAGSALSHTSSADRPGALFVLTMLAGIVMVV